MANPSTVTLFLGNLGGQAGAFDGAINTSISVRDGNTGATFSGTVTAVGNAATMFPMFRTVAAAGGFAVTLSNLGKTGFDGSKLTIGDVLTIGSGVATLFGASAVIGFGLAVGGLGWTIYTLSDPSKNLILSDLFTRAKRWVYPRDPIILDLDDNGFDTVGLDANIHFDHDGDGVLTKTGWAGKNDALLVWDRNDNGLIDTGAELFGDFSVLPNGALAPNGFAALAALDSNGDGVIDSNDPVFAELKLWLDTDQDGVTGESELISLAEAGIVSLNLEHAPLNQSLPNGNTLARVGSFTRADGSTSGMGEFHLAINTFDTRFAEDIDIPEDLAGLPSMAGSGSVRELRQAATLSGALQTQLDAFTTATTRSAQRDLLDDLLLAWADTAGMASLEDRAAGQYRIQYDAIGIYSRPLHVDAQALAMATGISSDTALLTDRHADYLSPLYRQLIDTWIEKLSILEAFNGQYGHVHRAEI